MNHDWLFAKITLMVISAVIVIILTKARIDNRTGNQFYIIMIIFWSGVFLIAFRPEILNSVLNTTGLVNRAQFLFSISIIIILYLLYVQTKKSKSISVNLNRIIREVALSNFIRESFLKDKNKTDLVIILVAKDEAKTIGDVIDKINSLNLQMSYRILVVNDGSTDDTEMIAQKKGALVINHHYNLGVGAVVKTGFLAARMFKPEIIINIDADGQHDPKYIPEMISKIKDANADLVYCSRFAKKVNNKITVRKIGNKFYTNLVNKIAKISITDVTSGYRCIKGDKLSSIFFVAESNFAIELALRAGKAGLKIVEIPAFAETREFGQSQFQRIEKFFGYNLNAFIQIFNAYLKNPKEN